MSGCIDQFESIQILKEEDTHQTDNSESISIACWNLQIFGKTKASNETLLTYYSEKLKDFDIFIIQEIRDSSGTAIKKLSEKFPYHKYQISKRAGQSTSKEQYAIFYNENIQPINTYDYTNEYQSEMQRPPFIITFTAKNWAFSVLTIHTDPDQVDQELNITQQIITDFSGDIIIIGDLNADGSYYDEKNIKHFNDWYWIIPNSIDTTVAASNNTYDRILVNGPAYNNYIKYGIMDDVNKKQSDHYIIYAEFDIEST